MAQGTLLEAERRTATGKGAARTLRTSGKIPAVIYGHNRAPEALAVDRAHLTKLLSGITASSGQAPVKALIREIQRNPLRNTEVLHLDLYEVRADEKITLEVPIHLSGTADGVRNFGGVLDQVLHRIQIRVFPGDIPASIEVDVTNLAIGKSIFVRDLNIPKVEILQDASLPVCSVVAPRTEEVAAPVATAEAPAEPELIRKPKAEGEEETEEKD